MPAESLTPAPELVSAALRAPLIHWQRLEGPGYTRSATWRVDSSDGPIFVKHATGDGPLAMLRREALVYRSVHGAFLPEFVGFAERDGEALLALEYLTEAVWPPPYPDDVSPLFAALDQVARAEPPAALPVHQPRWSRWERIAEDPAPFLRLGLCSQTWLERSLEPLAAAERQAVFEGDNLVHNDVYSANVCFTGRGVLLVDWGGAVRGSRLIDVAFALLSIRVEGGTVPAIELPHEGAFAAALAGHLAFEAPAPLPDWAEPGSKLREDMAGDLAHALEWAVDELELAPIH